MERAVQRAGLRAAGTRGVRLATASAVTCRECQTCFRAPAARGIVAAEAGAIVGATIGVLLTLALAALWVRRCHAARKQLPSELLHVGPSSDQPGTEAAGGGRELGRELVDLHGNV